MTFKKSPSHEHRTRKGNSNEMVKDVVRFLKARSKPCFRCTQTAC